MAGITVGLIALPLALALGIASVPAGGVTPFPAPALGLFTAIIAGFLISALGGSRVQIGGPTAAFVPIVLLIVEKHGYSGLILATMMAGVILVIMGVTRMGALIKFIPWPVTSGFTTGIAVSIVGTQVADFFGIRSGTPPPRDFLERMEWLWQNLSHVNVANLSVALACVAIIFLWPRLGIKKIPGSIVAMIGATVVVFFLGWQNLFDVATIGSKYGAHAIPQGLPALHWPEFSMGAMRELLGPATAIALLGAIESLLSAVVADGMTNDRHDSNTELIAQGVANIVCPFFCGLPATGAIARTSANVSNGGKSPIAGIVHSATLLAVVLLFAKSAAYVPVAAMSAVLVMVAFRMGEWHEMRRLRMMPLSEGDVLESQEQLACGKEIPEGVMAYRIFGPFLFGAAEKMEDALERIDRLPKVLILRLHLVSAMDATALNALESVIERLQHHGGTVILSGLHRQPLEMLSKAGFIDVIGRKNLCAHFDHSLERARAILAGDK